MQLPTAHTTEQHTWPIRLPASTNGSFTATISTPGCAMAARSTRRPAMRYTNGFASEGVVSDGLALTASRACHSKWEQGAVCK